jgi:hypothetical protein
MFKKVPEFSLGHSAEPPGPKSVTTNNENLPEHSIAIPACFWPESRKAAWTPVFTGVTSEITCTPRFSCPLSTRPQNNVTTAGSQAPAWEPICVEAPASSNMWMSPAPNEAREAGASGLTFPSWSLGRSERAKAGSQHHFMGTGHSFVLGCTKRIQGPFQVSLLLGEGRSCHRNPRLILECSSWNRLATRQLTTVSGVSPDLTR